MHTRECLLRLATIGANPLPEGERKFNGVKIMKTEGGSI
jgi:hypothetical protein